MHGLATGAGGGQRGSSGQPLLVHVGSEAVLCGDRVPCAAVRLDGASTLPSLSPRACPHPAHHTQRQVPTGACPSTAALAGLQSQEPALWLLQSPGSFSGALHAWLASARPCTVPWAEPAAATANPRPGEHQNNLQIDPGDSSASPSHVLLGASVRSSYCLLGEHRGLQPVTGGADPSMTSPWSPGDGRQGHGATEQMAPGLDRWEPCRCLGEPSRPCGAPISHGGGTSRGWGPATCPPAAPLPAARRGGSPEVPRVSGAAPCLVPLLLPGLASGCLSHLSP